MKWLRVTALALCGAWTVSGQQGPYYALVTDGSGSQLYFQSVSPLPGDSTMGNALYRWSAGAGFERVPHFESFIVPRSHVSNAQVSATGDVLSFQIVSDAYDACSMIGPCYYLPSTSRSYVRTAWRTAWFLRWRRTGRRLNPLSWRGRYVLAIAPIRSGDRSCGGLGAFQLELGPIAEGIVGELRILGEGFEEGQSLGIQRVEGFLV